MGSQLEIANFSLMPSLQTRRLNRHSESKRTLPMVTEQVYGGAKAQTNFSNSHPPIFHNTKSWRLIIDHRKKQKNKPGMLLTPMKERSTAGNEEIASSGSSRGRRKGRRKAHMEGTAPRTVSIRESWSNHFYNGGLRLRIWAQCSPSNSWVVDWSRGRQTHNAVRVIKCRKCQERIFRETRPTREV